MTSLPARLVAAGASLPVRPQYKRTPVEQDGLFFVFIDSLSGVCSKTGRGTATCSRGSGPSAAEARRKMSSWGSQVDLADELKKGLSLSRASVAGEDELLADDDVVSLTSSDPAASALLGPSQEEQEMLEDEEAEAEPFLISCPAYEELLEVMDRATVRLDLPWKRAREVAPRGRLDERYLSDHNLPAQVSLPFLPDLHTEIEKVWKRPFSSRIHNFPHSNYANIEGMREHGYQRMPPVEETLASYLSVGKASSLKTPSLPSIPLQVTSRLNGRAYAAAGQAVGALHTMAVLQAYQADLLKDLDKGQGLSPDEVAELRRTTDLALRATKQAATAMGRSMGAMVVTERHLWVNLADLGKKERGFLLDAPVSPSELFGTSVETVVEKFREARARSAAFKTFIPRRSRSEPEQYGGPGPSRSEGRRQAQKTSVATRAPPPPAGGSGRKRGSRGGRQDLREVIQTRQRARRGQSRR
ncbi:Lamina-associated polypeptide 2, isoform alpha [Labeo rohita]|uniref:Lamina-associated polypeptide 2, isoform alpha n=1 Tax=Labeo rohita TaxID=84645 RepID=A0ABQ8MR86_LABRO|nr:Lamina-associated polypeptide 2, isoform alpha [Labeo rohita]